MGLFDDVVQGIQSEFVKVQNRGQEMMQTYQLNNQIRALEGKKTAALIEIGRLVFEKYQRATSSTASIRSCCTAVTASSVKVEASCAMSKWR